MPSSTPAFALYSFRRRRRIPSSSPRIRPASTASPLTPSTDPVTLIATSRSVPFSVFSRTRRDRREPSMIFSVLVPSASAPVTASTVLPSSLCSPSKVAEFTASASTPPSASLSTPASTCSSPRMEARPSSPAMREISTTGTSPSRSPLPSSRRDPSPTLPVTSVRWLPISTAHSSTEESSSTRLTTNPPKASCAVCTRGSQWP
mmetsp:Transcript_13219/g.31319  ORF Transcript_13219/g.31319 Transcript_13219/m.31319 type:complete len:204 (-) Transcript_13219:483-1094(-)